MGKRVTDRMIYVVSALIVVSWPVAAFLLAVVKIGLAFRILIALVPVGILIWQIVLCYRYLQGQDEVQKRILLNGLAIGFAGALPIIFLLGFLMEAGIKLPFRFLDAGYFLEVALLVGYAVAWKRYL